MNEDEKLILKLVEELILAWSQNITPDDLSFEDDKVKLMIDVRNRLRIKNIQPSSFVRDYYREVFLRDQFGGNKG